MGSPAKGIQYALGVGEAGERRLRAIQNMCAAGTFRHLEAAGIRPGMRVLDVGCGIGTVTQMLAGLVGPTGQVVGVDVSGAQLALARKAVEAAAIEHCSFIEASAMITGLPSESFDLVYGRLLLIHLPDPLGALAEMKRLLKPNGVIAYEDIEVASAVSEPPSALDQFGILLTALGPRIGSNWNLGRRLYHLVRQAGFSSPQVSIYQVAAAAGESKLILEWTVAEASSALIETGLLTAEELNRTLSEMQAAGDDEDCLALLPRMFQVWAVKE